MSFKDQADELTRQMNVPGGVMVQIEGMIAGLRQQGFEEKALQLNDRMPVFSLPNAQAQTISSEALLGHGPLVVTFYRGSWCPYCNLALKALQERLDEITSLGATLVAITPERPDRVADSEILESLDFEVLTDDDNQLARKLGLVFELPKNIRELYTSFGLNVADINNTENHELPVPATYVVGTDGRVVYAFVDANYLNRAEPEDVITALRGL